MAKVFGILLIVLGVWLGIEIFTNGTDGAFGGIFAELSGNTATSAPAEPPVQKIRSRVQESMKAAAARSTSGLDERGSDEDSGEPEMVDPDTIEIEALDR